MDILPQTHSLTIPPHAVVFSDGTRAQEQCAGTVAKHVDTDVGLTVATCGFCAEEFVYVEKTKTWVTQKDFDLMIQNGMGELGSAIRSL